MGFFLHFRNEKIGFMQNMYFLFFYSFFFYSNKNKTGLLLCKICILFLDLDMFLSDFERFTLMCGWVSKELC